MTRTTILLASLMLISVPALASLTDQEILLAPVPVYPLGESQTTVVETSIESMPQKFSLGLGSGVNSFGGNRGELYGSSVIAELRGTWTYHPIFAMKLGADLAKYSFDAEPNGAVDVDTQTLTFGNEAHLLSTALSSEGFDPYFSLQGHWLNRRQNFRSFNSVERDSALGLGIGLGANFQFASGKFGLWSEAGASQIFFKDRYSSEYLVSGLEDTTGLLYSARLGMKYIF